MFETFTTVAAIVVPVFGVVGLGWLSGRTGYLTTQAAEGLAAFVFYVGVPILLFRTIANAEFPDVSPFPFWLSYFSAMAVIWAVATFIARRFFHRDARASIIAGVGAAFSNDTLVGLPVVVFALGEAAAVPMLLLVATHLAVMMTATTLLMQRAAQRDLPETEAVSLGKTLAQVGRNLSRNPIIIGIVAGVLWRLTGIQFGGIGGDIAKLIADAALPVALFSLGMSLARFGIKGHVQLALIATALKMIALPALVWFLAANVAHMPPLWVAVATVAAACPTGVNTWIVATRFNAGIALATNTITLTSAVSALTMSIWLALIGQPV